MNINRASAGAAFEARPAIATPALNDGRPDTGLSNPRAADKTVSPPGNKKTEEAAAPTGRAVLAVDSDHKVVVQFYDAQGKLIMQLPPEEAQSVKKELAELMKHLFSKEA
ncbi:MAG: hypothetical protein M0Z58_10165 [Nitrospiraceae bacterium]|nr:hypothetical protein [Nitrospiraceae bacterium]